MKAKSFALLAIVTALVIGGAYYMTQMRQAEIGESFEKTPLYPGLLARLNDATAVTVRTQADGTLTMTKEGETWRLAEKYGYPADIDKIRKNLVELASMEKLEPKTSKPENHATLYVEDVGAPDGPTTNSIGITVKAGNEVLADLLVGRTRPVDVGRGVFVRKAGEDQVWLASGSYQPDRRALQWLDRNIVNIDSRRFYSVRLHHADGDEAVVAKPEITSENMAYAGAVPEGHRPKPANEMNNLANIPDFLILEDVRPADELQWNDPEVIGHFRTYDGLTLMMAAVKDGKNTWFRMVAKESDRDPRLDAFVAENKGKDSEAGRIADQMKTAEETTAEIAELNERLSPWAFRFTDYKTGRATARSAELTEEIRGASGSQ